MKHIILTFILLTLTFSCGLLDTDKTTTADYNRGYNKNCNYQYGSGNSNCSPDSF